MSLYKLYLLLVLVYVVIACFTVSAVTPIVNGELPAVGESLPVKESSIISSLPTMKYPGIESVKENRQQQVNIQNVSDVSASVTSESYHYVTQWGSNGSLAEQFWAPKGIAVDSSGNVFVADTNNHRIQKFSSDGTYITQWGTQGNGNYQFNYPYDVAVDNAGYVYVVDYGNSRIQKFNSNGEYDRQWSPAYRPLSIAVDTEGNVFVTVSYNNNDHVRKYTSQGNYLTDWHGPFTHNYLNPQGIGANIAGFVYISSTDSHYIYKSKSDGTHLWYKGGFGSGDGQFQSPRDIAVDINGNYYVADYGNNRIQKFNSDGTLLAKFGSWGTSAGKFQYPCGIAVDSSGYVYVADTANSRIQKFEKDIPPTISRISPTYGKNTESVNAVITGTHFRDGITVTLNFGTENIACELTSAVKDNQLECLLPLSGHSAGSWDLTVKNADGTSNTAIDAFTILEAVPKITSISPSSGQQGGKATVTITGTNFEKNKAKVTINGNGVTFGGYKTRNTNKIIVPFTIAKTATTGVRTVTVTNPSSGLKAIKKFTVTAAPKITKITSPSGKQGKTVKVTITGKNFEKGKSTVTISGKGVSVTKYVTRNSDKIVAMVRIASSATATKRTVTVKNPTWGITATAATKFTVLKAKGTDTSQVEPGSLIRNGVLNSAVLSSSSSASSPKNPAQSDASLNQVIPPATIKGE